MSKSKGNVVTPLALLQEHGSDGVRYWAARGGPGVDTAFEPGQMKVGRRLAIKLLNASKFALATGTTTDNVTHPVDRGLLTELAVLVDYATTALEEYEYTRALDRTEAFFWNFCDNYLELVKSRRYGDHGEEAAQSANAAMQAALSVIVRLLAPFLPFVTEEVWSWSHEGSVHRAAWPSSADLAGVATPDSAAATTLRAAFDVLSEIRRAKSEAKRPLKAAIARASIRDTQERLDRLTPALADLRAAALVQEVSLDPADNFSVIVEFGDPEPALSEPNV
jgi:valyl-tRNA synthetase